MSSKFVIIIGPSGVGKGTLLNLLKERHPEFLFPVSATTREMRPKEENGKTYYFFTKREFENKIKKGEFLEYAHVHGENYYGTLKKPILDAFEKNKMVVREVDYQGFISIRKIISKEKLKTIFLLPPSIEILKKRIIARSPILEDELNRRMESLKEEMKIADECDIRIQTIDGDIEASYKLFERAILND